MLVQKKSEGSEPFREKNSLCEVGQGKDIPRTPMLFPDRVFQYGKARRTDVSTSENRSQEIEKSFAAERKIVLSRLIFQSQEIDFAFISIYYTKVYRIMILEEEQRNTKPWL